MRHLLLVAILLFVVEVTGAEFMNAERKCWEKSGCTEPTSFDRSDADKVNCYAYEHDCKGAEVKFAFVTIPKRGIRDDNCQSYFDCLLDNKVQFCHGGLCRREGVWLHHCERNLRNTRCYAAKRRGVLSSIPVTSRPIFVTDRQNFTLDDDY